MCHKIRAHEEFRFALSGTGCLFLTKNQKWLEPLWWVNPLCGESGHPEGAVSASLSALRQHVGAQHCIHAGQVPFALRLEPFKHVII